MKPTFGSAFAGIGGFELGLERAGWECRWQIENEKFCNRVLEKRWADIKRYGDIEDVDTKELEAVDLICGGFPCQDLSVAGKRGGLSGERSGLFWELVRLVRDLRPRWLLIENVPGFLSANEGEDFALALETLAECGYGLAWRVLDSQYFGVPQRRRRVFIVGHIGAMCPPEILFESEGGEGDIAEGGKAGEGIAYSLAGRPGSGGGARLDPNQETLIAGFSAGEPAGAGSVGYEEERSPTLKGEPSGTNQVPSIVYHSKGQDFDLREYEGISPSVTERWGTGGCNVPYVAEGDPDGGGLRQSEDRGGRQADAGGEPDERQADGGARRDDGKEADPEGVREASGLPRPVDLPLPIAFNWRSAGDVRLHISEKQTSPLHSPQGSAVMTKEQVGEEMMRRIKHCVLCPDSPRYRALGNAVTVQVAEWIGRRIIKFSDGEP